ncbi:MAG: XRE family transcriptional regulator [Bacteroidales bacterium]|nr:XRE family transcriptional regulator [Bacteroidales bacterium]
MILNEQIKAIAERLIALREVLDLSLEDVSAKTGISPEQIAKFESGESDIPMSYICDVAQAYNIQPSAIISGEEPKMQSYFLTRKGKGVSMERSKAYKYLALAAGFKNAIIEPFEVTIQPFENISLNSHTGQEFNFLLEGRAKIQVGEKQMIMEEGDSIYFDSTRPHGLIALDNKPARFLAIICK